MFTWQVLDLSFAVIQDCATGEISSQPLEVIEKII
jgi:hypothetical protein